MAGVPKQEIDENLRKLIPLNTLSPAKLGELLRGLSVEKVVSGTYLFRKGDLDQQNVYLLAGRVSLMNDRSEIDVVVGGSSLAKFPIAHRMPRECSAITKSRCEILRISNELLEPLLRDNQHSGREAESPATEHGDDWMSQLLNSRVFQQIPPAHIQAVMRRMKSVEADAGEEITRQGESGDYFYLINRGVCQVSRTTGDGTTELLAQLGPGDCFGEEALLSDKPRGSTVTMMQPGVLIKLSGEDFSNYVKSSLFRTIGYEEAVERVASGARWLDIRDHADFNEGRISGAVNIPMGQLRQIRSDLQHDVCHVVCCQDGQSSPTAAFLLIEAGIEAVILEDGIGGVPQGILEVHEPEVQETLGMESQGVNAAPEEEGVAPERSGKREEALIRALEQAQGERDDAKEQLQIALVRIAALEQQLNTPETGNSGNNPDAAALHAEIATLSAALDESYQDYEQVLARAEQAEAECAKLKEPSSSE